MQHINQTQIVCYCTYLMVTTYNFTNNRIFNTYTLSFLYVPAKVWTLVGFTMYIVLTYLRKFVTAYARLKEN